MSNTIRHRNTDIVTLDPGETINERCQAGDIAIAQDERGWWTHFVGMDGEVSSYDEPFESRDKALWAAKAAAEFDAE
jgi:hypothetical protein